jgi:hypothetical protein
MLTKVHAVTGPGVEVVLHVHAATDTLLRADRPGSLSVNARHLVMVRMVLPVLLKGPCSVDGGLVGTGGDGNVVGAAVSLEAALALSSAAGVVGAVGLDHVVLNKGVAGPSIDGKVTVALGVEGSSVVDRASVQDQQTTKLRSPR